MDVFDRIVIDDAAGVKITIDGYLVAQPRVARTGIQIYNGREVGRPELDTVRVYRPEEEVFNKDSIKSYTSCPMTNDHPPEQVDANNWKKYAVGYTGEDVIRDKQYIRVPLILKDAKAIKDYKDGKKELSLGYSMDLKWEPGKTEDGQEYDAVQTNIRANHLAVVAAARGGPALSIGDNSTDGEIDMVTKTIVVDGISVTVADDVAAGVIQRHISKLEQTCSDQKKKIDEEEEEKKKKQNKDAETITANKQAIDSKDAEIVTLKKQLSDSTLTPEKLDSLVKDRTAVIEKAKAIIGDKLVSDGKSVSDIRKQVVETKLGDAAKGWTDLQIEASFGTLAADVKTPTNDTLSTALSNRPNSSVMANDEADKAYDDNVKRLENAWRNPKAA